LGDPHPLLYELNARHWLYELSSQAGRQVTLSDVPESEFLQWTRLGFTHIWLMGVWKCGPIIDAGRDHWAKLLPDFQDEDVVPSPYAVTAYIVKEQLGGPAAMEKFREHLHQHGLKLVLDFVPNHTSSIHEWTKHRPELYVHAREQRRETFRSGKNWIAHGKDPYFAAWIDTAQLDCRNPDTRAAMTGELLKVSEMCDGVRCDMSMLLLSDVFARTWNEFPSQHRLESEFWAEAITRVKQRRPQFLFLAEAYWDLEQRLLDLGFDFAYDKRVYDHLIAHDVYALSQHLRSKSITFLNRATHFLENHDEERIASRLNLQEHCAAALLTLCLPGMRLLHQGQLTGARLRASVHLKRRAAETTNPELTAFYEGLLLVLRDSAIGKGEFRLIDNTATGVFALQWRFTPHKFDLALVNCGTTVAMFDLKLDEGAWTINDLLRPEAPPITTDSFQVNLKPLAAKLLRFAKQS
jgi:glycosidase